MSVKATAETKMMAVVSKRGWARIICRQLEPVEIGHDDVDQHDGDLLPQQMLERLLRRGRGEKVLAELAQDGVIAHELGRLVVDQQDVDGIGVGHRAAPQRWSHMRSADRSCSVLTGFAR